MSARAQLVAAINTFRGCTPTNPIDDDELANFLQDWLDYYDQTGACNSADVQSELAQSIAMQNSLVARSLSLNATIFVDGVNGNDARTGTTNDSNAVTGRVKTLAHVAQLHSGNLKHAKVMMMSMQQTPIMDNFEKDKRSERRSIPQELATHLSDTVDYYLCTKYGIRAGRMGMGSSIIPAVGFLGEG